MYAWLKYLSLRVTYWQVAISKVLFKKTGPLEHYDGVPLPLDSKEFTRILKNYSLWILCLQVMGPQGNQPRSYAAAVYGNKARRRQKQREHEEDYQKAISTVTDKLRELEGPDIKEAMKDQIRQWFIECQWDIEEYP